MKSNYYYFSKNKVSIIFFCILTSISVFLKMYFAIIVSKAVNLAISFEMNDLIKLVIALFLFLGARFSTSSLLQKVRLKIVEEIKLIIRLEIFNSITASPLHNFEYSFENLLITDVNLYIEDYYSNVLDLVDNMLTLVVAAIILFVNSPLIAINIIMFTFLQLLIPKIFKKVMQRNREGISSANGEYYSTLTEAFKTNSLLYSHPFRLFISSSHEKKAIHLKDISKRDVFINEIIRIISFTLSMLMYLSTMIIGAYFVFLGKMNVGMIVASSQLMNHITDPLSLIIASISSIQASKVTSQKISSIIKKCKLDRPIQYVFGDNHKHIIVADNISFVANNKVILKNISLSISRFEKIIIIGESGSGKSTLGKIISGRLSPTTGKITIQTSKNIPEENDCKPYELISYIPSELVVFNASIEDNITLFRDDLKDMVNKAGDLFKIDLSKEEPVKCSDGEKQRICVARSWIESSPVIVADECTSHLDEVNRQNVENILFSANATLIYITHIYNRKLIEKSDRIIHITEGEIQCMESKRFLAINTELA